MPWNETCAMDEKLKFVSDWLRGEEPMTVLCERYGISRETGYETVRRYRAEGAGGLAPRSRAPHRHGRRSAPELVERIVAARRERPFWGPKKLRVLLRQRWPELEWPAASTIGDVLRREGLSEPRRRRRRALPATQPFLEASAPNDVWCTDFKGWFRTADGARCDPLTITDAACRYVLACQAMAPVTATVQEAFERTFRAFGLPLAIRSDNGAPFASTGAAGLTRLSVWWAKLGIRLERIDPGQPQQNGRHERFHRTLKAETAGPPAATIAEQQARFDRFRADFNAERPHEALGQEPPALRYVPSPRPYPDRLPEPWYDADHAVRQVRPTGEIRWGGDLVFVSEALAGEPVGVAETDAGNWILRFANLDLGVIDRRTKKLLRFAASRPGRSKAAA